VGVNEFEPPRNFSPESLGPFVPPFPFSLRLTFSKPPDQMIPLVPPDIFSEHLECESAGVDEAFGVLFFDPSDSHSLFLRDSLQALTFFRPEPMQHCVLFRSPPPGTRRRRTH